MIDKEELRLARAREAERRFALGGGTRSVAEIALDLVEEKWKPTSSIRLRARTICARHCVKELRERYLAGEFDRFQIMKSVETALRVGMEGPLS